MKKLSRVLLCCAAAILAAACTYTPGTRTGESNEVIEAIMARRSVRKYLDKQVEHEKLEQIVNCGIAAPSGMNSQPWEIRVVEDPSFISGLTGLFKEANPEMAGRDPDFKNMFRNAPNVIFVATPVGRGEVDAGMLAENMMLAAQALGLGTCCQAGPLRFILDSPQAKPYLERLGFPEDFVIRYLIGVGYPDESPEAKPRDEGKIVYIR